MDVPLQIIDRYKHLREDKLVFGKMNYWSMCKKLKTVMTACGIEKAISYHCGRHSFATLALSKGMPIESVSRVLGHTNIVTTQIYARITRLQFKRRSQHDGAAAEGVVVGVGVDAVEDGVGVVALVFHLYWAEALKRDMCLY